MSKFTTLWRILLVKLYPQELHATEAANWVVVTINEGNRKIIIIYEEAVV